MDRQVLKVSAFMAPAGTIFGSGHEPQNSHIELGRSGVGVDRVYMRYFGAGASLIRLSIQADTSIRVNAGSAASGGRRAEFGMSPKTHHDYRSTSS